MQMDTRHLPSKPRQRATLSRAVDTLTHSMLPSHTPAASCSLQMHGNEASLAAEAALQLTGEAAAMCDNETMLRTLCNACALPTSSTRCSRNMQSTWLRSTVVAARAAHSNGAAGAQVSNPVVITWCYCTLQTSNHNPFFSTKCRHENKSIGPLVLLPLKRAVCVAINNTANNPKERKEGMTMATTTAKTNAQKPAPQQHDTWVVHKSTQTHATKHRQHQALSLCVCAYVAHLVPHNTASSVRTHTCMHPSSNTAIQSTMQVVISQSQQTSAEQTCVCACTTLSALHTAGGSTGPAIHCA